MRMRTSWTTLAWLAVAAIPSGAAANAIMPSFSPGEDHSSGSSLAKPPAPPADLALPDTAAAHAAFERFKALAGKWMGKSTKGWEEECTFSVIAGGSAVMETSFDAHPNETMVTLFAIDTDRLGLIHYCVAGNQPRLAATKIAPDGSEVTFTFAGGGNLPSRDRGHMDQAVFRFLDDGRMTSRWTWYQDGQERWLEEIEYSRVN